VGPRLAQAVLAVHAPDVVRKAIATGDATTLTRVPGIGKKGAERLILELRDRIGPVGGGGEGAMSLPVAGITWQDQVRQGLVGLGWTAGQADQAVSVVAADLGGEAAPAVPVLLKRAIQVLGRAR
jgi:Holliday junction DNA helicase RuvA